VANELPIEQSAQPYGIITPGLLAGRWARTRRSRVDDRPGEVDDGFESDLVDLTGVNLADLPDLDNPVLAATLRRIRDEADNPSEAVAGFQSSL
jgi:FXSXX-COOH protein